jgi:hypothetical protein
MRTCRPYLAPAGRATRAGCAGDGLKVMKRQDWFILVAIVGGLVLMFFITRWAQPDRAKPGTAEYEAYIERYVAECLRNPPPTEVSSTGNDLPTQAGRETACRATVLQADRFNPDGRPLKH